MPPEMTEYARVVNPETPMAGMFCALLLAGLLAGCSSCASDPPLPAPPHRPNVLLVTLDTTRADRIGCYGFGLAHTAAIDGLASEGVRCSRALASAPVTAPSHASMLTGLYPPAHGVRDNGVHRLSDDVDTLAEVLARHGYETAAFVSATVLHHRYNLSQGFSTYDDDLWAEDSPAMFFIRERPGARTVDHAEAWLDAWQAHHVERPFFAWVHLFDVHQPHRPAPADALMAPTPYDAEITGVDRQVGRLREVLERLGVLDDTLVIVTADHGESLGEHGEDTHAIFVYESTIHVPLVFRYPSALGPPRVYDAPVRHVDLMATVLGLVGIDDGPETQGRDLSLVLAGRAPAPTLDAYSESLVSQIGFGMAPLHAVRSEALTYIRAPRRELYDRALDPGELHDLSIVRPDEADRLDARLATILDESARLAHASTARPLDQETLDQLRALGYVGDPATSDALAGMDPKDGLAIHQDVQHARTLIRLGRCADAQSRLAHMLEVTPQNVTALSLTALCQERLGDHGAAHATYLRALAIAPGEERLHLAVALSDIASGGPTELDDAETHLRAAIDDRPDFVEGLVGLGLVAIARGDVDGAEPWFARALALDPQFPRGLVAYGDLAFRRADYAEALRYYRRALEVQPHAFQVLNQAAASARRVGDRAEALRYLDLAETERPDSFVPPYNRACLLALEGDRSGALAALELAVARGMPTTQAIADDPDLRSLAADPDFQRLARLAREAPAPEAD